VRAGVVLYREELEALVGLPWFVQCVYVFALKPRMNFETFRLGDTPRISWHALTEWLYVEPHDGPGHQGSVSSWQVMRAVQHLVRAGLVRIHSSEAHRILVFSFPMARRISLARRRPATDPHMRPARGFTEGKHPETRNTSKGETRNTSSSPLVLRSKQPTTTTEHTPIRDAGSKTALQKLKWPDGLSAGEIRAIRSILERRRAAADVARVQELLNELTARCESATSETTSPTRAR
jgi:hypothetical protein